MGLPPPDARYRRPTIETANLCKWCRQAAQLLISVPAPSKLEREIDPTLKVHCIITPLWQWCSVKKVMYP